MAIKTVMAAYFSPVGSTRKVTAAVAAGLAESLGAKLREFNWTVKKNREWRLEFTPSDLLVVGVPTYAGRIPNKMIPYVRDNLLVDRENAAAPVFAVPVVTYGGRAFDDALAEAAGLLRTNGFTIAGGAAMPCEHVFSDRLQPGRPTEEDLSAAHAFGAALGEKLQAHLAADTEAGGGAVWKEPVFPGNQMPETFYQPRDLDGNPTNFLKVKPVLQDRQCIGCGRCQSVCPMESILMEKCAPKMPFGGSAGGLGRPDLAAMKVQRPAVRGICIKCQACVKACPHGAWVFQDEAFLRHVEMLEHTFGGAARENEFFLPASE